MKPMMPFPRPTPAPRPRKPLSEPKFCPKCGNNLQIATLTSTQATYTCVNGHPTVISTLRRGIPDMPTKGDTAEVTIRWTETTPALPQPKRSLVWLQRLLIALLSLIAVALLVLLVREIG